MTKAEKKRRARLKSKGMDSGLQKPRSSRELKRQSIGEAKRRDEEARRKFGDRGLAGLEEIQRVEGDTANQYVEDLELIRQYGMDAPKARTFMTPANAQNLRKGGKVKAKKASKPKVRGSGKAKRGVRPAKMVKMKGA